MMVLAVDCGGWTVDEEDLSTDYAPRRASVGRINRMAILVADHGLRTTDILSGERPTADCRREELSTD